MWHANFSPKLRLEMMEDFELQSASAEHKQFLLTRIKVNHVNLSRIVSIQSIVKQIGGGDSSQTETASYNMIRIQHQHTKYIACKSLSYLYHIQIFNCNILQLTYPPILHQLMTPPPFTITSPQVVLCCKGCWLMQKWTLETAKNSLGRNSCIKS